MYLVKNEYDTDDRVVREDSYFIPNEFDNEGWHEYTMLEYYEDGKLYKESVYSQESNTDGTYMLEQYSIWEYDAGGALASQTQYSADGLVLGRGTYENGNTKEFIWFNEDGTIASSEDYVYDASGNFIYSLETDSEGNIRRMQSD